MMFKKNIFLVGAMDPDEDIFDFYAEKNKKNALERIGKLHAQYHNETNATGFLFVDKGTFDGVKPMERMTEIDFNEKIFIDDKGDVHVYRERTFYVVGVYDPDESLSLTYLEDELPKAQRLAERLQKAHYHPDNLTGFVFIERGQSGDNEPNDRIVQMNLDERVTLKDVNERCAIALRNRAKNTEGADE